MTKTYCVMSFDPEVDDDTNHRTVEVGLTKEEAKRKIKELEVTTDLCYYAEEEDEVVTPRRVSGKEGFTGQESMLRLAIQHLTTAIAELEAFSDMDTGEGDSACCNLRQAVECISESLGDMD